MSSFDAGKRRPITDVGDVVIQHRAPRVWEPCAITRHADVEGRPMRTYGSRDDAVAAARELLLPGRRIYIRHHDDAIWEVVQADKRSG